MCINYKVFKKSISKKNATKPKMTVCWTDIQFQSFSYTVNKLRFKKL